MSTLIWLVTAALAEDNWVATAGDAVRWPGQPTVAMRLDVGDKVEVLARQGPLVRVRRGTDFGWVDAKAVSSSEIARPAAPPSTPPGGGSPP
jgi:hypothetical protein